MKEKKQSALSALLEYAGGFKILTYLSLILSALSSVLSLMPFVFLWRIIREVLEVQPDFSRATGIVHNGWMAVLFAVLAALVYVGALVCSHGSAFRTAANMKKALMRHIARLPIGFADEMGSGKLRRIVTEVTGSTETLLAHNLPDMAGAIAMPLCMLVMLFVYDWRYGVAYLIPVALSFAVMMRMAGPAMQEDMRQYQNALERMSNEAVEYVRGVPVVKTFGQTVFSFHRFKASIDDYRDFCMHYTRMMRPSMVGYTVLINSAFVFILGLTLFLIRGENYQMDILLNFLFYVIFTPAIATTMTKVMFMSENDMKVGHPGDDLHEGRVQHFHFLIGIPAMLTGHQVANGPVLCHDEIQELHQHATQAGGVVAVVTRGQYGNASCFQHGVGFAGSQPH